MKLNEIIEHNKVNLERCTAKQADCMRNGLSDLREDENTKFLFKSCQKFGGFIRNKNGKGWTYQPGKIYKYVCTCLCWDKESDTPRCFVQFGFNNRNLLRNKLQSIQKNNSDIVCRIISIHEDVNEQK